MYSVLLEYVGNFRLSDELVGMPITLEIYSNLDRDTDHPD
jgi:hypothetical protein